jgi:flagellar hook assembly protein FlgD
MKTKSVVLAGVMVLASIFSFAIDPSNSQLVVVNQKEKSLFKVIYRSEKEQNVVMKIYGQSGKVVYSEDIKSIKGFIRPVNFSGMEEGDYSIEITDESGVQVKKIAYHTKAKGTSELQGVHISKISSEGKYLMVVSNKETDNVHVRIFDGNNNLVYNEDKAVNGGFGLVYNLNRIAGTPTFEISDDLGHSKIVNR